MRAIVYSTYGGPEVLEPVDIAVPAPKPGEVLVAVRLASVNPIDIKVRSGAMSEFMKQTFPVTPGSEMAGVVAEVGTDVVGLSVGDEVFGWATSGGYAEFATARTVILKPANLHWDTAVALPAAGEAALRALDLLDVKEGETLLIHGAAGAVGSIAVQFAVQRGATVIGTASEKDAETVRELGAHPVRYGEGVFDRVRELAPEGVDAVLDAAGAGVLPGSIELLGGTERVLTLADPAAYALGVTFSSGGRKDQTPDVLQKLADAAVSGQLVIAPARHFPLAEAARAQEAVAAGGQRGKVVLDI